MLKRIFTRTLGSSVAVVALVAVAGAGHKFW
jgi:hypothetical protein